MKSVRMLKDTELSKVGEIKKYSDKSADEMVKQGWAEYTEEQLKKEKKKNTHIKKEFPNTQIDVAFDEVVRKQIKDLPNTRFGNCLISLLKEKVNYDSLSEGEKKEFNTILDPVLCDTVEIMNLVKKQLGSEEAHKLIDHAARKAAKKDEQEEKKSTRAVKTSEILAANVWDNVNWFHKDNPFFYDKNKMFWFWNKEKSCWEIVDEVDIINALGENFNMNRLLLTPGICKQYVDAFIRIGRKKAPKEAPVRWVQFKNKVFSLRSGNVYDVTPDYFFTNPLPYELGTSSETPMMDKIFGEWVGEKYVQTLYEIIAYCCYRDYPIQLLFCFIGNGRNGKSRFLALLTKFLGMTNICSTDLDTLTESRFESSKMYRKLICIVGETNFGVLQNTSRIKKLTGQDQMGYEFKGKQPFDDYSYTKILVGSNSLPTSMDDSEGFYRRWFIIDFPNEFEEGKDILEAIPEVEYNNLARKVIGVLPKLLQDGQFVLQGTIEQRRDKYVFSSNPLPTFLSEYCERVPHKDLFISYGEIYNNYLQYLLSKKKRKVSFKEFRSALENEGYYPENTSKEIGLSLISDKISKENSI